MDKKESKIESGDRFNNKYCPQQMCYLYI